MPCFRSPPPARPALFRSSDAPDRKGQGRSPGARLHSHCHLGANKFPRVRRRGNSFKLWIARSLDLAHGFLRSFTVTHAAAHDGGQLVALLDPANVASGVWTDTAYRSAGNLALLERRGLVPQFPRARPAVSAAEARGKPMPAHVRRGNASRAKIRTIGLARATTKITLANLAYNMRRLVWFEGKTLLARGRPAVPPGTATAKVCCKTAARCQLRKSRYSGLRPGKPTLFELSA